MRRLVGVYTSDDTPGEGVQDGGSFHGEGSFPLALKHSHMDHFLEARGTNMDR